MSQSNTLNEISQTFGIPISMPSSTYAVPWRLVQCCLSVAITSLHHQRVDDCKIKWLTWETKMITRPLLSQSTLVKASGVDQMVSIKALIPPETGHSSRLGHATEMLELDI